MTATTDRSWVVRQSAVLTADPARVVARLFLPGQEMGGGERSRSSEVLARILALAEDVVDAELAAVVDAFDDRHRDLPALWRSHYELVAHRLPNGAAPSPQQRALIGAYFTQEFAFEAAALFNPSMAPHPDQDGLPPGAVRFVMTLRAVGEGHVSSIEMRVGVVDADGHVRIEPAGTVAVPAVDIEPAWVRTAFAEQVADMWGDLHDAEDVLDRLPSRFGRAELDACLAWLRTESITRDPERTVERFELMAACSYSVEFPASSAVTERLLMPRAPSESQGMEDTRLVRLDHGDGRVELVGTYTAFDGTAVSSQLLRTHDLRRFSMTRLSGPGSRNKGLALFPRRIDGRYAALSRADRETNGISWSDDLQRWDEPILVQAPVQPWEAVQLGNCGPPLETPAGWLVLTHGVGPMRRYSIGAILLDLDDPTRMIGRLDRPLLEPDDDERSGYVPNVVYSCGALLHGTTIVLPYGCSDSQTRLALVALEPLLAELTGLTGAVDDDRSEESA